MTRSTSKRNLRIGLIPDPLPRPDSASTHQKILPSNFLPIPPVIASVDQVSPSISKTLPSNLLAISIKIASIHPGSSPPHLTTTKQHWEPRRTRSIVGSTLAVDLPTPRSTCQRGRPGPPRPCRIIYEEVP